MKVIKFSHEAMLARVLARRGRARAIERELLFDLTRPSLVDTIRGAIRTAPGGERAGLRSLLELLENPRSSEHSRERARALLARSLVDAVAIVRGRATRPEACLAAVARARQHEPERLRLACHLIDSIADIQPTDDQLLALMASAFISRPEETLEALSHWGATRAEVTSRIRAEVWGAIETLPEEQRGPCREWIDRNMPGGAS